MRQNKENRDLGIWKSITVGTKEEGRKECSGMVEKTLIFDI